MTKTAAALLGLFMTVLTYGQAGSNAKLIELGKSYKDFMFRNEPTKSDLTDMRDGVPPDLKAAADFIVQTLTNKNKLLTPQFLVRPDDKTLKQVYIIRAVNYNLREENQLDNNKLVDSLLAANIPAYELVDAYYGTLFTAVGNKNQPFDMSKVDFKLKEYNFKDETEKGIFVLRCMRDCNMVIWGYMNVVNPPNTKEAYNHIKKYPKFNGRPYYQYNDFYFPDFQMKIIEDEGMQSYKEYYLNKFYETLIFHLICLNKEGRPEKERDDLLLGSILKERNLYKYTKYKDSLEELFEERKQD